MKKIQRGSKGQGFVEYALILALVSIVAAITVDSLGPSIEANFKSLFQTVNDESGSSLPMAPTKVVTATPIPLQDTICEDSMVSEDEWKITGTNKNTTTFGGQLCMANDKKDSYATFNLCSLDKDVPGDYEITVTGTELTAGDYGILIRAQNQSGPNAKGYLLQYEEATKKFVLSKILNNGKKGTVLIESASLASFDPYNSAHSVTIEAKGSVITAYLNGVEVLSAVDSTYTSGGVAVQLDGDDAAVCFDDFLMKTVLEDD